MPSATLIIANQAAREKAARWIAEAPFMTRMTLKTSKRTLPQNKRMWAMLGDLASQLKWHGRWLDEESWKLLFLDALGHEMRVVPAPGRGGILRKREASLLYVTLSFNSDIGTHSWRSGHGRDSARR